MSSHLKLGAINKQTQKYEYPKIASKKNKYTCPSCDKNVILRSGKINKPHFAHLKSENPCIYYQKPNETQIHKDAKLLMKTLLDEHNEIRFYRKCHDCFLTKQSFIDHTISSCDYKENAKAVLEHRFYYNHSNRSADVALVENDTIKYVFEICYKNKTKEENRPEPWFEIDAESFINSVSSSNDKILQLECIRNYQCDHCKLIIENNRKLLMQSLDEEIERLQLIEWKEIREKEEQEDKKRRRQEDQAKRAQEHLKLAQFLAEERRFQTKELNLMKKEDEEFTIRQKTNETIRQKKQQEMMDIYMKELEEQRELERELQRDIVEKQKANMRKMLGKDKDAVKITDFFRSKT